MNNSKIKVLWISARIFNDQEETQSGVWQKELAMRLCEYENIELGNVSYVIGLKEPKELNYKKIKQWGLPFYGKNKKGFPPEKTRKQFEKVVKKFNPNIIHIWGSENPFKLLPFNEDLPGIKVLAMQGVLESIGPVLLSGLSFKDLISTFGIRELIKGQNLFFQKRSFFEAGKLETYMIKKTNYIITQSEWTESQIFQINKQVTFFRNSRALRADFLICKKWHEFEHPKPIIFSSAVGYSLKGLHVIIKALKLVKEVYNDVELRLVGKIGRKDFLGEGYFRLILKMIDKYGLNDNVKWVGPLTAKEIVCHLQEAKVYVNPSFIESYSLTLAEAMSVGTPSVVSFAGAMPELAENNKEALFFTPGDYKRCAHLIIKLLSDRNLAIKISQNAIKRSAIRELKTDVASNQIEIYKEIIRLSKAE